MKEIDKLLRENAKSMEVSDNFKRKIDQTLEELAPEEDDIQNRHFNGLRHFKLVAVLVILFSLAVMNTTADANTFTSLRKTILAFLHIDDNIKRSDRGIDSLAEKKQSRHDLLIELQERVIDRSGIYLLLNITAPPDVEFHDGIKFDYIAFVEGTNYNAEQLIPGATDCSLLEVDSNKKNVAVYMMKLSSDQPIVEGSTITACFKDLMAEPYGNQPEMLVEGMWNVTFQADYTVSDHITVEGTPDMAYPFLGERAYVKKVDITPFGMTISTDISEAEPDSWNVSDTTVNVRLVMLDGTELMLMSRDPEAKLAVDSSSISYDNQEKSVIQNYKFEFNEALYVSHIVGLYIDDLFLPIMKVEE